MDLNAEQKKIAFQEPKGHALLKGVAGSGKTSVGIHRAFFLLHNYCHAKDDAILLATFNRTLIAYMAYLYDRVDKKSFSEFQTLFAVPEDKVSIKTVDSLMYSYFREYLQEQGLTLETKIPKTTSYEIMGEGIEKLKKEFPAVKILDQRNASFLLEEIGWIKDCLYLEEEEYQVADRRGKVRTQTANQPQRLPKNSDTRKAVFELLRFYDRECEKRGQISFNTMRVLALDQARKQPKQRFTHIIVDESQDLTRSQLLFLKEIQNPKSYGSIFFIGDSAQSIYAQSWIGSGRSFASIGFNMAGRSNSLSKNYRTTTQISQAAYSLIRECPDIIEDENFVEPSLLDKQGDYPVYKAFNDKPAESDYLCREIKALQASHAPGDIAIIARFRNQLDDIKVNLDKQGVKTQFFTDKESTFESDAVKLITMHSIKGLEFGVVFIIDLNDKVLPYHPSKDTESMADEEVQERRLLYVGMTRATDLLYLLSSATPSKYLCDIDPNFLRIERGAKIKCFYKLPVHVYRFKDKLPNIHAPEESVRQWLLAELEKTYDYPLPCLTVEYPVKEFSRKGYVDVALLIQEKGRTIPFMFIEIKRPGSDLEDALRQVKSYMSHCPECRYGAVTDGTDIVVIDRELKPVGDIPRFKNSWLSATMLSYEYRNLKHRMDYRLLIDDNDPSSLEVQNQDCTIFVEGDDICKLPVYGRIAAGQPIHMNPEIGEAFYFPKDWHRGAEHFVLKVRGDSMENAGVFHGDYVVVRTQSTADNLDLAVVAIGEEATLKKFNRMGSNILLTSENPRYEPILLTEGQLSVLGVAVGLIKTKMQ
jgi:SOS regulatory protein LexA